MATAIDVHLTSYLDPFPLSLVLKVAILRPLCGRLIQELRVTTATDHWWSPGTTLLSQKFSPPHQREPTHQVTPSVLNVHSRMTNERERKPTVRKRRITGDSHFLPSLHYMKYNSVAQVQVFHRYLSSILIFSFMLSLVFR